MGEWLSLLISDHSTNTIDVSSCSDNNLKFLDTCPGPSSCSDNNLKFLDTYPGPSSCSDNNLKCLDTCPGPSSNKSGTCSLKAADSDDKHQY